jgi:hypothetical protein
MAVVKLNGEKMSKNKKQKPTNNDFVVVINGMLRELNSLKSDMNAIMGAFDLYIDLKGDTDALKSHIDSKLIKKDDSELQETGQNNTVTVEADSTDQG